MNIVGTVSSSEGEAAHTPAPHAQEIVVSVVMPCLNEAMGVGKCVEKAMKAIAAMGVAGEVVVVDNGSTDDSAKIAAAAGARVIHEPRRGYGSAYLRGFAEARGKYMVMGDSDDTYDFSTIADFIKPLRDDGFDMVMGTRLKGKILPGAMPWSHRWIGNPILSGMLKLLYHTRISDSHCGMRSFTREAYERMRLQTTGMEFASEIVVNSLRAKLKIHELPITYYPRIGESKLSGLRDAWRHVRFMLLFSPGPLFVLPGMISLGLGLLLVAALFSGPLTLGTLYVGVHYMVLGSALSVLGLMLLSFGISAKAYAFSEHLVEKDGWIDALLRVFTLERGLAIGGGLVLLGAVIFVNILFQYLNGDRQLFNQLVYLHQSLAGATLLLIGMQIASSAFFLSLLEIARQHSGSGE